jgi:4-amino-4-deoxy-L-arabinose transferase-like glycosyltransferase
MTTNHDAGSRPESLVWSAVHRAARLLIIGFIGWLWFMSAENSAWKTASLAAALAVAALVGITWYLARAGVERERRAAMDVRAERRWRAALDRYAEREQAKGTNSRRNVHARPQSQGR